MQNTPSLATILNITLLPPQRSLTQLVHPRIAPHTILMRQLHGAQHEG